MSEENVETVRATLDAWNRGDWDAALVAAAPDVVFDASGIAGEWRRVHRGRDQVKRQWDSFVEPGSRCGPKSRSTSTPVSTSSPASPDGFWPATGSRSKTKTGFCFTFRDGLMTHVLVANDFGEALEAAGLSE